MQQRLEKDLYKILNQVNNEEIPDGLKLPDSYNQLVSEIMSKKYDAKTFAFMLRAMVRLMLSFVDAQVVCFVFALEFLEGE